MCWSRIRYEVVVFVKMALGWDVLSRARRYQGL